MCFVLRIHGCVMMLEINIFIFLACQLDCVCCVCACVCESERESLACLVLLSLWGPTLDLEGEDIFGTKGHFMSSL